MNVHSLFKRIQLENYRDKVINSRSCCVQL